MTHLKINKVPWSREHQKNRPSQDPNLEKKCFKPNVNHCLDIKDYFDRHHHVVKKNIAPKSEIKFLVSISMVMETLFSECPICYDFIPKTHQVSTSECKHMFCETCTFSMCKNETCFSCPMCRTNVTEIVRKDHKQKNRQDIITSLQPKTSSIAALFANYGDVSVFHIGGYMVILFRNHPIEE